MTTDTLWNIDEPILDLWQRECVHCGEIRYFPKSDPSTLGDEWECDCGCKDFLTAQEAPEDIDIPDWIDSAITPATVAAIVQGGCASGAYMPAVTYHTALETMSVCGDDVLQYIDDALGELPAPPDPTSWAGLACHYLSTAVELWAHSIVEPLAEALTDA